MGRVCAFATATLMLPSVFLKLSPFVCTVCFFSPRIRLSSFLCKHCAVFESFDLLFHTM